MSTAHETLLLHDAPRTTLALIAEKAAGDVVQRYRWKRSMGDVSGAIGLRIPWGTASFGERVSIAVEEKSFRILSCSSFRFQLFDRGRNQRNVERVRESLLRAIAEHDDATGS